MVRWAASPTSVPSWVLVPQAEALEARERALTWQWAVNARKHPARLPLHALSEPATPAVCRQQVAFGWPARDNARWLAAFRRGQKGDLGRHSRPCPLPSA